MVKVNPEERIKTEDILNHDFFIGKKANEDDIPNQQITEPNLIHESNNKKNYQKLIVDQGSFTMAKPQILNGNNEEYNSFNSVESGNSISASPQSIKLSSYAANKRDREVDPQFKTNTRKSTRIAKQKMNVNLSDFINKKEEAKKEEQGKELAEEKAVSKQTNQ